MTASVAGRNEGGSLAKLALAAGVLAVAGFFGLGFTLNGWWFLIGFAFGIVAVITGVAARRRPLDQTDRRMALVGMILGGAIAIWFVGFLVVSAIT